VPDDFLSWCIAIGFGITFVICPVVGIYYAVKHALGWNKIHEPRSNYGRHAED
jgi:hypothetical protein